MIMEIYQILILQLIAHLSSDFIFQSDLWSRHKRRYGFLSKTLYWHAFLVFMFSYVLSFQWDFIPFSITIALTHLLIDGYKIKLGNIRIGKRKPFKRFTFFIDQFLHLTIIGLAVYIFNKYYYLNSYMTVPLTKHQLLIILGYLICLKPSNILIKEVFGAYKLKSISNPGTDLLNAGKLIGNIERVLTLTLLILGQYEAIGFLIAGKSILRYEGVKTAKTEYVLIGTLLSFGIAIVTGVMVLKIHL